MPREYIPKTKTLGIDLASQARETGVCLIDWSSTPATIEDLGAAALDDDRLMELMTDPTVAKVAIDAPFAWPLAFVDAVVTYRDHGTWLALEHEDVRYRLTERVVAEVTNQAPLSVATSDLAWPAMRLARLLTRVAVIDGPVDRAGGGRLAEVYPAAALRCWGVIPAGTSVTDASYKNDKPGREEKRRTMMVTMRQRLADVVAIDDATVERCIADDDDLDAFVAALVARALLMNRCRAIPSGMRWAAVREGWIHLPAPDSLAGLTTAA